MAEAKRRAGGLKTVTDDKAIAAIGKAGAAEQRLYNPGRLVSAWIWETDAEFRLTRPAPAGTDRSAAARYRFFGDFGGLPGRWRKPIDVPRRFLRGSESQRAKTFVSGQQLARLRSGYG